MLVHKVKLELDGISKLLRCFNTTEHYGRVVTDDRRNMLPEMTILCTVDTEEGMLFEVASYPFSVLSLIFVS